MQGGIASSNSHTCKEINTGIYFAFFVAPSGVILSSILLDSVSSRLLDNRSLWGDTTTPPIEGRWSLSVDPSKPLILLGLWRVLPFLIVSYLHKPLILLGLWRKIEKGQTDGNPLDPSNYKRSGLAITRFRRLL